MEMTDIVQNKDLVRRPEDCRTISELSATEDDKTLQKVVHKLKRLFGRVISAEKAVTSRSAIIETDYDQNKAPENNEQTIPVVNNFGSFDDLFEYRLCQNISKQLEQLLSNYGKKEQKCQLLVPSDLPPRIAQDVLRMSQNEPCGVRGCVLFVNMEGKAVCHRLGKIECDPATVATFELYLTLKEDTRPWVIAKTLLASVKGCLINGNSSSDVKVLHTGFQLAKRKLYRRN